MTHIDLYSNLYPERVFYYFNEISKIPRGSKKEKEISDWLVKFAKNKKLEVVQDDFFNVFIRKKATKGYEKYSPLILQGHTDMVWEKNKDKDFDFSKQGIEIIVENGFLKANGTTLGADNGIFVAYALAILESDKIKHPELEIIFTTNEEDGMTGASNLDFSIFKGKTLINLDMQEYGKIFVSSAGGARTTTTFDFETKKLDKKYTLISIEIKGLAGGHSGIEIHKNLGNSNKILGEILYFLNKEYKLSLNYINGGDKLNAIPRETTVCIGVNLENQTLDDFYKKVNNIFSEIIKKSRLENENPKMDIKLVNEDEQKNLYRMSSNDTSMIIDYLNSFPNGVLKMSENIENLVETSLNLGSITTQIENKNIKIIFKALHRSSIKSSLNNSVNNIKEASKKYNATCEINFSSPIWEYKKNSKMVELVTKSFKNISYENIEICAIHAGLECGVFVDNIKNLDVVSLGPNIYKAHTPEECVEIKSVGEVWKLLLNILENYNL